MMSKAAFLALFGILFLQAVSSTAGATTEEDGKIILDLCKQLQDILPWAHSITQERIDTFDNITRLMPKWDKVAKDMTENKADKTAVANTIQEMLDVADEAEDMEIHELEIMSKGRMLIKKFRCIASQLKQCPPSQ